jgi:hypothetical protein
MDSGRQVAPGENGVRINLTSHTAADNLVTICRAHHWKVHEGGWRLIRTDEGVVALPPVADDYGPARDSVRPTSPEPLTAAPTSGPPQDRAPDTG